MTKETSKSEKRERGGRSFGSAFFGGPSSSQEASEWFQTGEPSKTKLLRRGSLTHTFKFWSAEKMALEWGVFRGSTILTFLGCVQKI